MNGASKGIASRQAIPRSESNLRSTPKQCRKYTREWILVDPKALVIAPATDALRSVEVMLVRDLIQALVKAIRGAHPRPHSGPPTVLCRLPVIPGSHAMPYRPQNILKVTVSRLITTDGWLKSALGFPQLPLYCLSLNMRWVPRYEYSAVCLFIEEFTVTRG